MSPMTEADHMKRIITAFIASDEVTITLQRPTRVTTPSGGKNKTTDVAQSAQKFRLIPFKRRLILEFGFEDSGEEVKNLDYVLVGVFGVNVQDNDWFEMWGHRWEVKFVTPKPTFARTAAGVRSRGPVGDG